MIKKIRARIRKISNKGGLYILKIIIKLLFSIIFLIFSSIFTFNLFYPIYTSKEIIIPYGLHPFDICLENPDLWNYIKITKD